MTLVQSILATLAYSDIFDYPLTGEEVWLWLVEKKASFAQAKKSMEDLVKRKKLGKKGEYYCLKNRTKITDLRLKRLRYSSHKLSIALKSTTVLRFVPTVIFVGLTGALAMDNSDKEDDIDLLIICYPGTVWLTRLVATVLLVLFGLRRGRLSKNHKDKICLNMFVGYDQLKIKPHNLYNAHEILQIRTLWDKGGVEESLLKNNRWVWKFLPNQKILHQSKKKVANQYNPISWLSPLEEIAYLAQMMHMRRHITREIVGKNFIAFHPRDTQDWVMISYRKKVSKLFLNT